MTEGTGTSVQCQLDTGATWNAISHKTLCKYYETEGDEKHGAHPIAWWQCEVMGETVGPFKRNDENYNVHPKPI
jgi:hypothetical protein